MPSNLHHRHAVIVVAIRNQLVTSLAVSLLRVRMIERHLHIQAHIARYPPLHELRLSMQNLLWCEGHTPAYGQIVRCGACGACWLASSILWLATIAVARRVAARRLQRVARPRQRP